MTIETSCRLRLTVFFEHSETVSRLWTRASHLCRQTITSNGSACGIRDFFRKFQSNWSVLHLQFLKHVAANI